MKYVLFGLAFWAGGAFTLAVTTIDREGCLTLEGWMDVLGWPLSFLYWIDH